jgi:acyl-ACP thioesterase
MVVDARTHRPVRPEIVADSLPLVIEKRALDRDARKVRGHGEWKEIEVRKVRASDMDINAHMNNSRYVDWIFDALDGIGQGQDFSTLEINYLAESHQGEEVRIETIGSDGPVCVRGVRPADERQVFMAQVT